MKIWIVILVLNLLLPFSSKADVVFEGHNVKFTTPYGKEKTGKVLWVNSGLVAVEYLEALDGMVMKKFVILDSAVVTRLTPMASLFAVCQDLYYLRRTNLAPRFDGF